MIWDNVTTVHYAVCIASANAHLQLWCGILTCNHHSRPHITRLLRYLWLVGSAESGRATLSSVLRLCEPLTSVDDVTNLKDWLAETWTFLAMVDYPYAASFLEPLPAWPIKVLYTFITSPAWAVAKYCNKCVCVLVYLCLCLSASIIEIGLLLG